MDVLTAEALALSPEERAVLAERLLESLELEPPDPVWEGAWAHEVDRRERSAAARPQAWRRGEPLVAELRSRLE